MSAKKFTTDQLKQIKSKKVKKPISIDGAILWEGKSAIDGANIVVIINNMVKPSGNRKTGDMAQTYILRTDMKPIQAVVSGQDRSICGDCPHRPFLAKNNGQARCYVNTGQGANSVYGAYIRGSYPRLSVAEIAHLIKNKEIRFGTYGDPMAAPLSLWFELAENCRKFTGYTHQWKNTNDPILWASIVMASTDSDAETLEAMKLGFRTFQVKIGNRDLNSNQIFCPASNEGGNKTQCNRCLLCGGNSVKAKNIVIMDHGIGWQSREKAYIANLSK
jgi:hypothetical protein